jgi:hypothetical protein
VEDDLMALRDVVRLALKRAKIKPAAFLVFMEEFEKLAPDERNRPIYELATQSAVIVAEDKRG